MASADTMRGARRSRATVAPNIVNDSIYPDPTAGMDTGASKARRDAKRAARSGTGAGSSGDMGSGYSTPGQ